MEKTKSSVDKLADFLYERRYFFFTLLFIIFLCFAPLRLMETTKGHDTGFHLQRIAALAEEMKMGNYFPRIYTTMLDGLGYGSPMFYGDLFVAIPAALVAFWAVELTDALAYFIAMIFAATVLSMYFCTYSITKCKRAAFCGGVMFGLSSYLVTDLIYRCALGEAQAFVFIPVAFTGLYHILYGNIKKWYLLPVGLAATLYCHTLSALITVVVLFIFLLLSIKKVKENLTVLTYIGISAAVFFALSANLLFPMLEQMASTTFLATDGYAATRFGTLSERAFPWWSVLYDYSTDLELTENFQPNGIGMAGVILAFIYIANRKKFRNSMVDKLLIMAGITVLMPSSLFPWGLVQDVAGILQFPWRLFVFPTFFVALAAAKYFSAETEFVEEQYKETANTDAVEATESAEPQKITSNGLPKHLATLMYVVLALSISSYTSCFSENFNKYMGYQRENDELQYKYKNYIGSGEYLPSWDGADKEADGYITTYKSALLKSSDTVFSDGDPETNFTREDGKLIVEFKNMQKENAYLDVPLIMYKGYSATFEDGTKVKCGYGDLNYVRVNVGPLREGTITFEYTGTAIQKVSGIISIIAVIALAVYIRISVVASKKKDSEEDQSDESKKTR
ncbi:MAG: hypothetical protein J6Q89_00585 [Clostridia bacterium]|nr:hypothetical protein [Clostridia bacterium]